MEPPLATCHGAEVNWMQMVADGAFRSSNPLQLDTSHSGHSETSGRCAKSLLSF